MNPHKTPLNPWPLYGQQAYHYLYGRQHLYGQRPAPALYGVKPDLHPARAVSLADTVSALDDKPQTVEQLITDGYFAVPEQPAEMALLYDRGQVSWMALDDLLGQVHQRREIYRQNMNELEWAKCYAFNELARHGWPVTDEQQAVYEKRLQDLHGQQRAERLALWQDLARLRERIPETAQLYLSALRKLQILGDAEGDAP